MTDTNPGGWPDASKPGVPQNPERDGWHWTAGPHDKPEPTEYRILSDGDGYWWWRGSWIPPERAAKMAAAGYRYLGPCLTPAEVAAQVEAARREEREACAAVADHHYGQLPRYPYEPDPSPDFAWDVACMDIAAAISARGDAPKETGHE